jgi:short subunit dehydrogenase-like uncharacterized protein
VRLQETGASVSRQVVVWLNPSADAYVIVGRCKTRRRRGSSISSGRDSIQPDSKRSVLWVPIARFIQGGLLVGTVDVLLLGASGHMGRLIAAELADRGMSIGLAGRDAEALTQLARRLSARDARGEVRTVDGINPASMAEALVDARMVLSTVGPFTRWAGPVVEACLAVGVSYVDIANEWPAVRQLLDRDGQARDRGVTLVSGAGFGVVATETLVVRLLGDTSLTPARVRVAGAPAVATRSEGVASTVREAMSLGAVTYRDGQVAREPLGTGATVLSIGGVQRRVFPGPVGDLEAARMASGAAEVVAYVPEPSERGVEAASYAWAEVTWPDGRVDTAELRLGDGNRATAAIAAETTARVLAEDGAGAWTPCRRFGAALVTEATDATVTVHRAAA